ncbi:hypothetical protein HEP87_22265 [Streptomyces sp. S1D4-11]|nr:hypothetical protein [Streptomyces sp. S1D4-11]QIY96245.1 hypothetical protein HEP87_22265 [Streptomyces sp. S1D4-11]
MQRIDEFDFGVTWLMSMFHQDWSHHGPTAAEAVQYHLWEGLDQESVLALRRDARLLQSVHSETVEALWQAGTATGPDFFSGGRTGVTSGAQWVEQLIALCDAWLSAKQQARPLTGSIDAQDGADVAEAVLDEIGRARFVPDDIRLALAECARRCTPDLAFRLLLRAMIEAGAQSHASLTTQQYARLETLGSALHYGEFVVSEVKHLVAGA